MVGDVGSAIATAVFLAVFVKAALDKLAALIRGQWPGVDLGLPFGVLAMLLGGGLGWLAGVNVFVGLPFDPLLGRVLTAIAIGLGTEFLNDVTAIAQGRQSILGDVVESGAELRASATDEPLPRLVCVGPKVRGW